MPKAFTLGSRLRVGIARKRSPLRCGWGRSPRAELGTEQGSIERVACQLGYGTEPVRLWVNQADIDDGDERDVSTDEAARGEALEQEVCKLRRANEILKRAAFFGLKLDRQHK